MKADGEVPLLQDQFRGLNIFMVDIGSIYEYMIVRSQKTSAPWIHLAYDLMKGTLRQFCAQCLEIKPLAEPAPATFDNQKIVDLLKTIYQAFPATAVNNNKAITDISRCLLQLGDSEFVDDEVEAGAGTAAATQGDEDLSKCDNCSSQSSVFCQQCEALLCAVLRGQAQRHPKAQACCRGDACHRNSSYCRPGGGRREGE